MPPLDPLWEEFKQARKDVLATDPAMIAPNLPDDVIATDKPLEPEWDPQIGRPLNQPPAPLPLAETPPHRLVALGDSLTHGFQSGAIFNTDLSYPAIIAYELGWYDQFRRPTYPGLGGIPLNIELLLRKLERSFGAEINWWELAPATFTVRQHMAEVEDWWERGPGARVPNVAGLNHNLAVYGWDLRDALSRTAAVCAAAIKRPKDQLFMQLVENANERAALRVFNSEGKKSDARAGLTVLDMARQMGEEGAGGQPGIETLIVFLGANNALGSVLSLQVNWSGDGYDKLDKKTGYNVWRPTHFKNELELLAAEVRQIKARHVVWCTVPHVTIAPIARGVARKLAPGSRYFPYYTRPWILDGQFDAKDDPHLTGAEARAIDSAIDQYNYAIRRLVRAEREAGRDWLLFDVAGLLDRLACRRYEDDPAARPVWWRKYELPPELTMLDPTPDSRFFTSDATGRRLSGGLFSLDGVHPTTVSYGILAQEFINIMQQHAAVTFYMGDGVTPRTGPVKVNFKRLIAQDSLVADPPKQIAADLRLLGWADQRLDLLRRLLRVGY
ncbi:MAG TPA: hypothetical protein VF546_00120 [Pyrinomonadaceae bacterium]|jgi:hypothetical protein